MHTSGNMLGQIWYAIMWRKRAGQVHTFEIHEWQTLHYTNET